MRAANAIRCEDVDDPDSVEVVTVDCYRCDPDNPLAVPREACSTCRGTGRSPVEFVPILREIRDSQSQPKKKTSRQEEDFNPDLNLEY